MKSQPLSTHLPLRRHVTWPIWGYKAFASPDRSILRSIAVTVSFLLISLCSSHLWAQVDTGGITGIVTDTSGAVIPGATVTITNNATGIVTKEIATSTGQYVFGSVPPGTYTLQVKMPGFGIYSASGIAVHIQQTPTINVALKPGSSTETITVTSATPLMQAQSAEVSQTITGQEVNDLPLSTRDWTSLGQTAAGVTTNTGGKSSASYFAVNGQSFNQNDFRLDGIDDNVEMFPSGVHRSTNAAILPPPDALQEFTLQNSNFSAEFGHSLGGVVNAVVKSGTNQIHGDLWEYVRNDAFNANDYFSNLNHVPIKEYRQNQFGGTVGGPVVIPHLYNGRNRTFFFFDIQSTRIITPVTYTSTVPTANMIASNFTNLQDLITYVTGTKTDKLGRVFPQATVFDPATTRAVAAGAVDPISGFPNTSSTAVSVRDPFFTGGNVLGIKDFTGLRSQLNILPASRLDPNAIGLLKVYPSPTTSNAFTNNYFASARSSLTYNQFDIRGDEQINDHNSLFAVFSWDHTTQFTPNALPGIADGATYATGTTLYPVYEIAGGYTHIFTPNVINTVHVGYNHAYQDLTSAEANIGGLPAKYGIGGVPDIAGNGGLPNISISGLTTLGVATYMPTVHTLQALQLNDTLSWIRGAHNLTAGYELISIEGTALQPAASRGTLSFNGQYSSIPGVNAGYTGMTDMLLVPGPSSVGGPASVGGASSYSGSNYYEMDYHRWYTAAFAQDDWHVTPAVTLNLGLRWDLFTPYAEVNGHMANAVYDNGNGPGGIFYLPNKTCNYPRSATFNQLLAKDNINVQCIGGLSLGNEQYVNFAPRLGFAFQPTSRWVTRGGFGIAYGAIGARGTGQTIGQNYPFEYTLSFSNTNPSTPLLLPSGQPATLETAIGSLGITDPANVSGAGASLYGRQFDYQTPYTEATNLTVQFAVNKASTLSAGYVGQFGRHLQVENVHNSPSQIVPPGASIKTYIPFPEFAPNSLYETTNGASSYNSLQTVYQLRTNGGDVIVANYTYSKCMQNANEFQNGVGVRAPWLPGWGISAENQLCGADATHVIHGSGTYNLPFGHGRRWLGSSSPVVDTVLGGWIANAIYSYQSGSPVTIGCPTATTAFFGCNANKVPGVSLYAGARTRQHWLSAAAFANPPVANRIGDSTAVLGGEAGQARGPGYANLDASIFKQFVLHESLQLQLRAEAFNAFNHTQFANPSSLNFTDTNTFGQITGLRGNARLLQFAAKLFF
jgi:hypothetical protein